MTTENDFYRQGVTTSYVIGGPGRVLVAATTVSYPLKIADVINFSTYAPQANWFDLGHTSEPFTSTEGFETTDWISQQIGKINIQVGTWNRTIGITFLESKNTKVFDVVHETAERVTDPTGSAPTEQVSYHWDKPEVTEWRMAVLHYDFSTNKVTMDVFPRIKRSGADSEMAWDRGNPQAHGTEFVPLPDSDVPNTANWYRIEQL